MKAKLSPLKNLLLSDPVYLILKNITSDISCSLYLVGGCIRDHIMGKTEKIMDLDFASDKALKVARHLSKKIHGTFILLDEEDETGRVVIKKDNKEITMDFSQLRGNSIEEDIYKRDFSINSIAVSYEDIFNERPSLIDPSGGYKDIKKKSIKVVSPDSFPDDPLRMVRAFRFGATLDFIIHKDTKNFIKTYKDKISLVSVERIEAELFKMLEAKNTYKYLKTMYKTGLLQEIIPETANLSLNKWKETFIIYKYLDEILNEEWVIYSGDFSGEIRNYLTSLHIKAILKFSIIIHNIKDSTICLDLCRRMKMSNYKTEKLVKIISYISYTEKFFTENNLKMIIDFFRKTGEDGIGILLTGCVFFKNKLDERELIRKVNYILTVYYKKIKPLWTGIRIITGEDLVKIFKLKPGPEFKKILETVEEKQIEGTINNREEALEFIRTYLAGGY